MPRQRATSSASQASSNGPGEQELGSMYDYLAKVILLGPSSGGKSCLLHRFVKDEWRILTSQTIGVEFASKIVKVGSGSRRKRIKLQLWDTAGTERFRSVSRSYYRGAAGAILVYDITSRRSFNALPTFLNDARALASPELTVLLAGNKVDLADAAEQPSYEPSLLDGTPPASSSSFDSRKSAAFPAPPGTAGSASSKGPSGGLGSQNTATTAPDGREVAHEDASRWASTQGIPVSVEVSALSGDGVGELFARLARIILTKIELGEINPDDPHSGIQYGDAAWGSGGAGGAGGTSEVSSIKSGMTLDDGAGARRRRRRGAGHGGKWTDLREWQEVFKLDGRRKRSGGCC